MQKRINEEKYKPKQDGDSQEEIEEIDLEKQVLEWESQKFDFQQEYDKLIKLFEKDYPDYYNAKHNTHTVFEEIFESLNINQCLIEYFVWKEYYYIFAFRHNDYVVKQFAKPDNFNDLIQNFNKAVLTCSKADFTKASYELYQLLIEPIADLLNDVEDLIIIRDAAMSYLPFEALLSEKPSRTKINKLPYLLKKFEISYHFSATLWYYSTLQKNDVALEDNFIGFAPLYGGIAPTNDDFTEPTSSSDKKVEKELPQLRAGMIKVDRNGQKLIKLEYAEKEVEEIGKAFEQSGLHSLIVKDKDATPENFIQKTKNYKYILVSGHGFYDDKKPELSGIVFSPSIQKEKTTKNEEEDFDIDDFIDLPKRDNAILYVSDSYILQLKADLVVLSCCESGMGKIVEGEGVMGINRGFLYSGAKNVVYTLFKVPDKASYQLTKHLFDGILEGKSYKKALRDAKLQLIEQEGIEPIHWAGYVLVGK